LQLSGREFRERAEEVDDLHRDAMRTFEADVREIHHVGASRRQFLKRAGVGGALAAVGGSVLPIARFVPAAWAQAALTDVDIAAFAQSVELAAVDAYTAAANSGKLSADAVAVGTMFASHHNEHAGAFAGIAGASAPNKSNQAIVDDFGPRIANAADEAAILQIAFDLEGAAAATYLFALGALQDPEIAATTATILPVESQHQVVLGTALGKELEEFVPAYETKTGALDPEQYPIG